MGNLKQFIKDLEVDDMVQSCFLLKKKELAKTKTDKPYLKLELSDKTGNLEARMWDNVDRVPSQLDTGEIAYIEGIVSQWQGNLQINVDRMVIAPEGEYRLSDMVRAVENIDEIFSQIKTILNDNLKNKYIISLANRFFSDAEFVNAFKKAPGARSWHNAYIGGLMEHTFEVMKIVLTMCEIYQDINIDIALLGALLHDSGKLYELDRNTFEYTDIGSLIGHISIGYEILLAKIQQIEDFPSELALQLKHIILSHHGEYEQQSPVLPKTLEAIVVYHADNLVSQANAVREIMHASSGKGRDWSNFISIKNRKFYLKRL